MAGYASGCYLQDDDPGLPLAWVNRERRGVILLPEFRWSRSTARTAKSLGAVLRVNQDFQRVVAWCASAPRGEEGTWLTPRVEDAYLTLHRAGLADSFELWSSDEMLACILTVRLGRVVFAESMAHTVPGSGAVCVQNALAELARQGCVLYDMQRLPDYMRRFGAIEISRQDFEQRLGAALLPACVNTRPAPLPQP